MSRTITSSNAIYTIAINNLFPVPIQLQGFSTDDIFTTQPLASAETMMGLDGRLSGGFVYVAMVQNINLQADSASNDIFDQWWQAQQLAKDVYSAEGIIILQSVGKTYAMSNGYLTSYPPVADAAKTLRPRRFAITWNSISPGNIER